MTTIIKEFHESIKTGNVPDDNQYEKVSLAVLQLMKEQNIQKIDDEAHKFLKTLQPINLSRLLECCPIENRCNTQYALLKCFILDIDEDYALFVAKNESEIESKIEKFDCVTEIVRIFENSAKMDYEPNSLRLPSKAILKSLADLARTENVDFLDVEKKFDLERFYRVMMKEKLENDQETVEEKLWNIISSVHSETLLVKMVKTLVKRIVEQNRREGLNNSDGLIATLYRFQWFDWLVETSRRAEQKIDSCISWCRENDLPNDNEKLLSLVVEMNRTIRMFSRYCSLLDACKKTVNHGATWLNRLLRNCSLPLVFNDEDFTDWINTCTMGGDLLVEVHAEKVSPHRSFFDHDGKSYCVGLKLVERENAIRICTSVWEATFMDETVDFQDLLEKLKKFRLSESFCLQESLTKLKYFVQFNQSLVEKTFDNVLKEVMKEVMKPTSNKTVLEAEKIDKSRLVPADNSTQSTDEDSDDDVEDKFQSKKDVGASKTINSGSALPDISTLSTDDDLDNNVENKVQHVSVNHEKVSNTTDNETENSQDDMEEDENKSQQELEEGEVVEEDVVEGDVCQFEQQTNLEKEKQQIEQNPIDKEIENKEVEQEETQEIEQQEEHIEQEEEQLEQVEKEDEQPEQAEQEDAQENEQLEQGEQEDEQLEQVEKDEQIEQEDEQLGKENEQVEQEDKEEENPEDKEEDEQEDEKIEQEDEEIEIENGEVEKEPVEKDESHEKLFGFVVKYVWMSSDGREAVVCWDGFSGPGANLFSDITMEPVDEESKKVLTSVAEKTQKELILGNRSETANFPWRNHKEFVRISKFLETTYGQKFEEIMVAQVWSIAGTKIFGNTKRAAQHDARAARWVERLNFAWRGGKKVIVCSFTTENPEQELIRIAFSLVDNNFVARNKQKFSGAFQRGGKNLKLPTYYNEWCRSDLAEPTVGQIKDVVEASLKAGKKRRNNKISKSGRDTSAPLHTSQTEDAKENTKKKSRTNEAVIDKKTEPVKQLEIIGMSKEAVLNRNGVDLRLVKLKPFGNLNACDEIVLNGWGVLDERLVSAFKSTKGIEMIELDNVQETVLLNANYLCDVSKQTAKVLQNKTSNK